jgi:threonyl-tRNA synthetase
MRILQLHSDFIEYEPIEKEIKIAEETEKKKNRLEDIVVLFAAIEDGDNKDIIEASIDDVKASLKVLNAKRILIYPYAHLSNNLAKPEDALKLMKHMENYAKESKLEVFRAPFGWCKQFLIKIKGHPLAEQSKFFTKEKIKEKKTKEVIKEKPKKVEEQIPKELSDKDHRLLGQKLDLYSFQEEGPGMVFFHPKGMIIWNTLIDFWRKEHIKNGYLEIKTPLILNQKLWEISGHWDHYKDLMFFTQVDEADFAVKPMNCPGAILVYKNTVRSYRDLPLRLAEVGLVYRNELSGVLSGLFRLRGFTQDDAHIFVTPEQIEDEVKKVIELTDHFYKVFGFEYHVELSTRPEKFIGTKEMWDQAEDALKKALNSIKLKFKLNPGDGAFYGPKIDFHIKDSLNRTWQCATIQVDFAMPERFGIYYIDQKSKQATPVIIHRVIYGSVERFIGILVEHYNGAFPVWLSPIQVRVMSLTERNVPYAKKVTDELLNNGIRVDADFGPNTIEYKVRNAQLEKINYMLVVGDKEEKNQTVAVRTRDGKVKFNVKSDDFIKQISEEIKNKK